MELINNTNGKELENTELVEAIAAMRKEFNNETQNRVLNAVLHAEFYVPAVLTTKQQLVADPTNKVEFRDQKQATFLLITNSQGVIYLPAFTDKAQSERFRSEEKFGLFTMAFADLAGMTEKIPQAKGFLINPDREALPFTKEILAAMKEQIKKKNEEIKELMKNNPNGSKQ